MNRREIGASAVAAPAVFLDRDGTIIAEVNYLRDPSQICLLPNTGWALRELQKYYKLVLVTNQAGIARGYFDEDRLGLIHSCLVEKLALFDITLAGIYYCPHHPRGIIPRYGRDCLCRKPNPGMLFCAKDELGLDLANSYMVGDKLSDIEAGRRGGTKTALIRTGYGLQHEAMLTPYGPHPHFIGNSLMDVAVWILGSVGRR